MAAGKKLYRSNDSVLGGVCAGLAEYSDIDPIIVRILAALLALCTGGVAFLLYLALWFILPRKAVVATEAIPCDAYIPYQDPSQVQGSYAQQPGFDPAAPYTANPQWQAVPRPANENVRQSLSLGTKLVVVLGVFLLAIGIAGFLGTVISGVYWWQFWPMFFILAGFMTILTPSRRMSFLSRFSLGISVAFIGALLLMVSCGVLSWATLHLTFANLWPLLCIVAGFLIIGAAMRNDYFGLAAAACVVAYCVSAMTIYAVPGGLDALTMSMPFMEPRMFDINPWD